MHCLSFPGHCAFQLHTAWILVHSWHPAAFLFILFPLRFSSRPCPVSSFLHLSFSFSSTLLRRTARFFPRCSYLLDSYPSGRDKKLETLRPNKKNVPRNCFVASGIPVSFGVGHRHFSRFRRTFAEKVTSVNRDISSSRTVFTRRIHR